MSNGDSKNRVSRIKRIFQDNDKTSDTWVDVERIVELWVATGDGPDWQERHYTFDWNFDDKNQKVATKKIHDPTDENNVIEVPIRSGVTVEAKSPRYQKYVHKFGNGIDNTTRHTRSRKIYHYDIDEDRIDSEGQPPHNLSDYKEARDKDKDKDMYVEVEIIDTYEAPARTTRDQHGRPDQTHFARPGSHWPIPGHYQNRIWHFQVSSLLDKADEEAWTHIDNPGADQIDPPWRLDPLQNIVNVNWGGLAVIFGPGAAGAPTKEQYIAMTKKD